MMHGLQFSNSAFRNPNSKIEGLVLLQRRQGLIILRAESKQPIAMEFCFAIHLSPMSRLYIPPEEKNNGRCHYYFEEKNNGRCHYYFIYQS
jgi:hypothetical protein